MNNTEEELEQSRAIYKDGFKTKGDVLSAIEWHQGYFDDCEEIGQGINSKDVVRMSYLVREAVYGFSISPLEVANFTDGNNVRRALPEWVRMFQ
jgi:hypothetical protein